MKRISLFIAVAMALAACNQDEILNDGTIENVDMTETLEANIVSSRLNIEGTKVTWAKDDSFQTFDATGKKSTYKLVGESGTTFNKTSGDANIGKLMYAIYPTNEANTLYNGKMTFQLPLNYTSDIASKCIPMIGEVTGSSVKFSKYLTAVLNIKINNLPAGYDKVIIKANKPISGTFTYDTAQKTITGASNNQVTIDNVKNMQSLYIPIAANTEYRECYIGASNGTNELGIFTFRCRTFELGKIYTVTLDYKDNIPTLPSGELTTSTPSEINNLTESKWVRLNDGQGKGTVAVVNNTLEIRGSQKEAWTQTSASLFVKDGLTHKGMVRVSFKVKGSGAKQMGVIARTPTDENGNIHFFPVYNFHKACVEKARTLQFNNVDGTEKEYYVYVDFSRHSVPAKNPETGKDEEKPGSTNENAVEEYTKASGKDYSIVFYATDDKASDYKIEIKNITISPVVGPRK